MCVCTVLYKFKVLYKEWLSDQATDRMMLRNSLFSYSQGGCKIASGRQVSSRCEPLELLLGSILISGIRV